MCVCVCVSVCLSIYSCASLLLLMGRRQRTQTDPLRFKSSRLRKGSSNFQNGLAAQFVTMPMDPFRLPQVMEEDLEAHARATLSLFGFGSTVHWAPVSSSKEVMMEASNASVAGTLSTSSSSSASGQVALCERVCPIGKNAFLWNVLQDQRNASIAEAILTGSSSTTNDVSLKLDPYAGDIRAAGDADAPVATTYMARSQLLQHYFVRGTAVLHASLEEVIELIIRSDKEDSIDIAMQHMAGVKTIGSGLMYRRHRVHHGRSQRSSSHLTAVSSVASQRRRRRLDTADSFGNHVVSEGSDSDSSSEETDAAAALGGAQAGRMRRTSSGSHLQPSNQSSTRSSTRSRFQSADQPTTRSRASSGMSGYLEDYHHALMGPHGGSMQGNLSVKWVVGDRGGRMFSNRVHLCVTDYECIVLNDWEEETTQPMYVRMLQSCYLPQCQPWIDEFGSKPTDLQPIGIMVREVKDREGYVEVQLVASLLERAHIPFTSRRAKLRSICQRLMKLEEIVTSRRLSQSLLLHKPSWVRNGERSFCHCCEAKFHLSRRRHHCRLCGEICCSDCCPKVEVALPDVGTTSVRVCAFCVKRRRYSNDSIASSSSSSTITSGHQQSPSMGTTSSSTAVSFMNRLPPPQYSVLSSSSSSEYLSSSYSSVSSMSNGISRDNSMQGERKASSLSSSILQRFKHNSLGI